MTDDLARRRAAKALPPRDPNQLAIEATADGMVQLPLPGIDARLEWTPDEAQAFAVAMLRAAAEARSKR